MSSLPQGLSEDGSARIGSREAHWVLLPGAGMAWRPLGCPTRSPARDFPLGLYVPCMWICSGTGDDDSHFLALLTQRSRFHFLNPCPCIFFVVSSGGEGSVAGGWCLLQGALSRSGGPAGVPLAAPAGTRSLVLGAVGVAQEGTGSPPQRRLWSGSGYAWGPLHCSARTVFAYICKRPCQICKFSPAEAPRAPNCLFLLHPLRHQRAWPGPASG